jgi:hypothetical protein
MTHVAATPKPDHPRGVLHEHRLAPNGKSSLFPCADRPNVKIMDTAHAWTLQQEGADSSDICPRQGRSD